MKSRALLLLCAVFVALPATAVAGDDPAESALGVSAGSSEARVESELSKSRPDLWFCDENVDSRTVDKDWCTLADDAAARCPGLAKVCKAPTPSTAPPPERPRDRSSSSSSSGAVSSLAEIAFWLLVGTFVALIAYQIVKALVGIRRDRDETEIQPAAPASVSVEKEAPAARRLSDPERLLGLAEQAAQQGRYAEGMRAAYAALAHALRAQGLFTLEVGQSNGELLRALSAEPELARVFRSVSREVESIDFGGRPATAGAFERTISPVRDVVRKLATSLAVLSLALLVAGCSDGGGTTQGSPDKGPSGYFVLKKLLAASGSKVRERYLSVDLLDQKVDRVIVTAPLESEDWASLLNWTFQGGHLVTSEIDADVLQELTEIGVRYAACGPALTTVEAPAKLELRGLGSRQLVYREASNEDVNVALRCGDQPYWIDFEYNDGTISLLAEPSFLQNASLVSAQNALFVSSTLGEPDSIVEIVGPFTGRAAGSPFSSLRRAGLMPAVLQLLLLGALFAWRYGAAFGKRRDPRETRQRRFVEHVRVLGACYERARATKLVLTHYGSWLVERASRRALGGRRGGLIQTASAFSLTTGIPEGQAAELVTEVRLAQAAPPDGFSADDLEKVRRLEELTSKTGANS